jgi:translation initiation factor IF-3
MAPEVRVIGPDGEQMGVMSMQDALRRAADFDVDVVETVATASPPVVRLIDYGKFKYQEQKREAEAKAKQTVIEVKEIKLRPGTDEGDYQVKMRNIKRFLEEGDKVKVTLRFRGREITHQELGMAQLERIKSDLGDLIIVESMPKLEGKQMIMMIAPNRKKAPTKASATPGSGQPEANAA